jgi:ankyrin repeat protein
MIMNDYLYILRNGFFPLFWSYFNSNFDWDKYSYKRVSVFTDVILTYYPTLVNIKDINGNTLLIYYSKQPLTKPINKELNIAYICKLIFTGCDINSQNKDGWNALMYAVLIGKYYRNSYIVELLLKNDAETDIQNKSGGSAIFYSCIYNDYEDIFQILYEYGCDLNIQCNEGWTPFMVALYYYQEHKKNKIIDLFLRYESDIDINLQCSRGWTHLMYAIEYTNKDIIKNVMILNRKRNKPKIKPKIKPKRVRFKCSFLGD